jgi:hypothetical protein
MNCENTHFGMFGQDGKSDGVWGPGLQQGLCMSNPSSDDVPQNLNFAVNGGKSNSN